MWAGGRRRKGAGNRGRGNLGRGERGEKGGEWEIGGVGGGNRGRGKWRGTNKDETYRIMNTFFLE